MYDINQLMENPRRVIWRARKRTIFGLPWTFTLYSLTPEKFMLESGFLRRQMDEVRLYRVQDLTFKQSLVERILGLGTIVVESGDRSMPHFEIARIRNSRAFMSLLSDLVEENRRRNYVYAREVLEHEHDFDH